MPIRWRNTEYGIGDREGRMKMLKAGRFYEMA